MPNIQGELISRMCRDNDTTKKHYEVHEKSRNLENVFFLSLPTTLDALRSAKRQDVNVTCTNYVFHHMYSHAKT